MANAWYFARIVVIDVLLSLKLAVLKICFSISAPLQPKIEQPRLTDSLSIALIYLVLLTI
jgi:hypothetical protein